MEPHVYTRSEDGQRRGWVEVVCGSMFSGKTEELLRRLKRARIARQRVALFKPALDTRYHETEVVSHDATAMPSEVVHSADPMLLLAGDADVVGIDEAQFFGVELVDVVEHLAREGRRVIVAGLDQDYLGRPFEPVPQLMAVAEHVTKLHAVCVRCGAPANHSQRIVADGRACWSARPRPTSRGAGRCFRAAGRRRRAPAAGRSTAARAGPARPSDSPASA